ncbi:MAG: hypothetical protein HYZ43_07940 [Flavobacteriia bacterium]|nr:hypothetical protein [Flavobacteriia bacterium]
MKKHLIHSLVITKPFEKVQLQIPIPRNAKKLVGLRVTTSGHYPFTNSEIGWLWLRIPEMRDVFFAEIVRNAVQEYGKLSFAPIDGITFGSGQGWIDGGKDESFSIEVDASATLFEGYYTDRLGSSLSDPYTVKIYLTLEL